MIMDAQNRFSNAQAVTATAVSTDVIDFGVGDKGINDKPLRLRVQVDETATSAGASTLVVTLETDDVVGFGSAVVVYTSASIAKAAIVAGAVLVDIPIPYGMKRYARLNYTIGTANLTAGKFTSGLLLDTPKNTSYPDARSFA